jgi:NAD(P)-dependent dehydrogenase (short-subunit alcohol dehydrogenase family)
MRVGPETPVVVSGGASGLGAATARALARRGGAPVAVLDLDADRGARLADEIHGLFCEAHVTDPAGVGAALDPEGCR